MRKLNYFIVGLSQLIMGTMTIGFVSCEQNLEALDNSPQMAEAMVGRNQLHQMIQYAFFLTQIH